jgi:hypothetical protein
VNAYTVFQQSQPASLQEAVVPLEARNPSAFILGYNNANSYATGVALANVSSQSANIAIVIRDDNGVILQSSAITIPALGHTSFNLASNYPVTSQRLGTIEFDTPAGGQISVLGLRFDPGAAFSTVPPFVR